MSRSTRKLIGAAVMLAFVLAYALLAMVLAQARPLQQAPAIVQWTFYVVAGLAWIAPLMPLIAWMEKTRPDDLGR